MMPLAGDELVCPKFQPNIFDSTRCHDCLRQKQLHHTCAERAPEQSVSVAVRSDDKDTSAKVRPHLLHYYKHSCSEPRERNQWCDSHCCVCVFRAYLVLSVSYIATDALRLTGIISCVML